MHDAVSKEIRRQAGGGGSGSGNGTGGQSTGSKEHQMQSEYAALVEELKGQIEEHRTAARELRAEASASLQVAE